MKTNNFIYLDKIDSTNSYAMRKIVDLPDKQVIVADMQTTGRGRLERKWLSSIKDNVYMSIVLKPSPFINNDLPLHNITQYMSVIICRVLKEHGIFAEIKWPNDVLVEGKKIAGILSETSIQGQTLKGIVIGVGININSSEEDLELIDQPATSLNILLNSTIDKNSFINKVVEEFFKNYDEFLVKGFVSIKKEYVERSSFIGKNIQINAPRSTDTGVAKDINDDGSLLMETEEEERTVTIGDLLCL